MKEKYIIPSFRLDKGTYDKVMQQNRDFGITPAEMLRDYIRYLKRCQGEQRREYIKKPRLWTYLTCLTCTASFGMGGSVEDNQKSLECHKKAGCPNGCAPNWKEPYSKIAMVTVTIQPAQKRIEQGVAP